MRRDDTPGSATSRGYVALTGAMIGAGVGVVWLHSAAVESCLLALLGAFLAWTLAGEWRPAHPMRHVMDGDGALIETETMPLLPTLSWPAPFPVQVHAGSRQEAHARRTLRTPPRCTAARRHATRSRTRRSSRTDALRRTSR